ncbi:Alpha/Beta hydrolase protein [Panaeolus papilionaceus]|nr:Alpha/Beta hydrolase protein [Panaeolus papilionaceus]
MGFSTPSSSVASKSENYLVLPDERTLAYTEAGDPSSSTVVIHFHSAFGVGRTPYITPALQAEKLHIISPTLHGWGRSSPRNKSIPYHECIASDITALVDHLHPHDLSLKIYLVGISYGSVPAQMLYGAPFELFPLGRCISGCLLIAPLSPFKYHHDYTAEMTSENYIAMGPPSRYLPFKVVPRLVLLSMTFHLRTVEKAEHLIRSTLFDVMDEVDKELYANWRGKYGWKEGELEREMATEMVDSVADSWVGWLDMADNVHGDWGFHPAELDDDHNHRPIFIVTPAGERSAPEAMAKWLQKSYQNSRLETLPGGHVAALLRLDEVWKNFRQSVNSKHQRFQN